MQHCQLVFFLLVISAFSACKQKPSPPVETSNRSSGEMAGSGSSAVKPPVLSDDAPVLKNPNQEEGIPALIKAISHSDIKEVRRLLKIPAVRKNINDRTSGRTALEVAATSEKENAPEIMKQLLEAGANPILTDEDGNTLLITMAFRGNETAVRRLLEIPAVRKNINAQGKIWTALSAAAYNGHLKVAKRLFEAGADPTLPGKDDDTPLMSAVEQGKLAMVRWLLKIQAVRKNINARTSRGTALKMAATSEKENAPEIMKQLLEVGADPILTDEDGNTLLMGRAFSGDETAVRRLLEISAVRKNINARGQVWTALSSAAYNGHLKVAKRLFEAGADPTLPDQRGNTPLMNAVKNGELAMVRWLLSIPAVRKTINYRTFKSKITAFEIAVESKHKNAPEIMEALLEAGADPILTDEDGDTLLMNMALNGDETAVRRLLEIPAVRKNINAQGKTWTALYAAAYSGHLKVAKRLFEAGADPTLPGKNDATPLMSAVEQGKLAMVRWLLSIPAVRKTINYRTSESKITAFEIAVESKHKNAPEIMEALLEDGADPIFTNEDGDTLLINTVRFRGDKTEEIRRLLEISLVRENINVQGKLWTAFSVAAEKGNLKAAKQLFEAGADPTLPGKNGDTPLMNAAAEGELAMVRWLLSIPAVRETINDRGKYGRTALSLAKANGFQEIVDLLIEAGATPDTG